MNYSVRVGLLGTWGSGKTSVAGWIEHFANSDGHKVIWYNPWSATSIDSLWLTFYQALRDGLGLELSEEVAAGTPSIWATLRMKLGKHRDAVQAVGQMRGAPAGLTALALDLLKITPKEIESLRTNIGPEARVIVIIDDLDRADPALLPKLLLSLRELLDYPGFSFLLPFDLEVVSEALTEHYPAWKTGDKFLEKILDYRLELPELTSGLCVNLFRSALVRVAPGFRLDLAGDAVEWLPPNPRRIKSLARAFQAINEELSRHNADEIDWRSLLFATVLRGECESFSEAWIAKVFSPDQSLAAWSFLDPPDYKKEVQKQSEEIIQAVNAPPELHDRLKAICLAWLVRGDLFWIEKAKYALRFAKAPEGLTWKEFDDALEIWTTKQDIAAIHTYLTDQAKTDRRVESDVMTDMANALAARYQDRLDAAASSFLLAEQEGYISEANAIADLIDGFADSTDDTDLRRLLFLRFLDVVNTWAHFDTNTADVQARKREIQILTGMLKMAAEDWQIYADAVYELRNSVTTGANALDTKLRPLLADFDTRATDLIVDRLQRRGEIGDLLTCERAFVLKNVLLDVAGPAWSPARSSPIEKTLANASKDANVQLNAKILLEYVVADRLPYLENGLLRKAFAADKRVISALWRAAVAQQIQFRMLESVRDIRDQLVKSGIPDAALPMPKWLTPPAKPVSAAAKSKKKKRTGHEGAKT